MFSLSVRFLDGSCQVMELGPDSTIAELKNTLEQEMFVGPLHEVMLMQGVDELKDDGRIIVEVQAVTTSSPGKAVAAIERACRDLQVGEALQEAKSAVALLAEGHELTFNLGQRLLTAFDGLQLMQNCPPNFSDIVDFVEAAGRIFGNATSEPTSQQRDCLVGILHSFVNDYFDFGKGLRFIFASAALVQIGCRCDVLQQRVHEIVEAIDDLLTPRSDLNVFCARVTQGACRLSGAFGNLRQVTILDDIIRTIRQVMSWHVIRQESDSSLDEIEIRKECSAAMSEAAAAIQIIKAREWPTTGSGVVELQNTRPADATIQEASMPSDSVPETEEAADLMEALVKSKQDIPKNGVHLNRDGVVVFLLKRMGRSERLREHLRTTPTLAHCRQRVEDAGCSLTAKDCDAQLFVPLTHEQVVEAGLELADENVVMLSSDFELFKCALHEFNCKGKKRPTLDADFDSKKNGTQRLVMPEGRSAASSASNCLAGEDLSIEDEGPVEVEPVGCFNIRTDSSLGFPQNPHMGYEAE